MGDAFAAPLKFIGHIASQSKSPEKTDVTMIPRAHLGCRRRLCAVCVARRKCSRQLRSSPRTARLGRQSSEHGTRGCGCAPSAFGGAHRESLARLEEPSRSATLRRSSVTAGGNQPMCATERSLRPARACRCGPISSNGMNADSRTVRLDQRSKRLISANAWSHAASSRLSSTASSPLCSASSWLSDLGEEVFTDERMEVVSRIALRHKALRLPRPRECLRARRQTAPPSARAKATEERPSRQSRPGGCRMRREEFLRKEAKECR